MRVAALMAGIFLTSSMQILRQVWQEYQIGNDHQNRLKKLKILLAALLQLLISSLSDESEAGNQTSPRLATTC
jgi:hypothetical protein